MKFSPTKIGGVWVVDMECSTDERGWFSRAWCADELSKRGLNSKLAQCSVSFNRHPGTLRGMHYQVAPYEEAKLVRCLRGSVFDVALDVRRTSPTYGQWLSVNLTPDNGRALYVPEGCAHGFQTLEENTEVLYFISAPFHPESARGIRWDDPAFGIKWPSVPDRIISDKDRAYLITTESARR